MDQPLRQAFNAAYSPDNYRRFLDRIEGRLGEKIPFRVAESPLFLPRELRHRLERSAREIVDLICNPALIKTMTRAVPAALDAPNIDELSNCIQVDFAITREADGSLTGKLVELQGFPSLYSLIVLQTDAWAEELELMGMGRRWTTYFGGLDRATYISRLRRAIVGDHDPAEVVLLDLDPTAQKTHADFVATRMLTGVEAVCPTTIERDGNRLFRSVGGKRVPIKRIYNRVVFDELLQKAPRLPFSYADPLDVSWFPHPNWYWIWSKYTLPHVDHEAIPKATFLSDLTELPDDLTRYVLKPLFSFAGAGVKVDVTPEDIAAVPDEQRSGWILQRKIEYAPALVTPEGHGVKAEVRMMFLRAPGEPRPELAMNLVRLSRGKMLGVDHNKDFEWVGGSVGIWSEDE
jgi:hypothetical protein